MITRIAGRSLRLQGITTLACFWNSGGFKDGGKGGKGGFFGRRETSKDNAEKPEPPIEPEGSDNKQKTVRFLKKHELRLKDIEPQPRKELRFRKKDTYGEGETEKPAPFVSSEKEEKQEDFTKKSFFLRDAGPPKATLDQLRRDFSYQEPQLNQQQATPPPENKFYENLSNDLDRILDLFERKQWKELNALVEEYHTYTPAQDVEKELHSLLISADVANYVAWLRNLGRGFRDLSDNTLRKLYNGLVSQYKVKELKELLSFFKSQHIFNVEYKSIDILLADIQQDAPLKGLEPRVNEKIELALEVLAAQLRYNQKHESEDSVTIYTLDEWFNKLAHLALTRKVARAKFMTLFEEIFTHHFEYMHLEHIHASGLFLNIIETFYYGSYVTTSKLQALFADVINGSDMEGKLSKLRDSLVVYRARTGKFAFPNARRLVAEFQKHFEQEHFQAAIFCLLLLGYSDEPRDVNALMERRLYLINQAQDSFQTRDLLNDALWALSRQQIASDSITSLKKYKPEQLKRLVKAAKQQVQADSVPINELEAYTEETEELYSSEQLLTEALEELYELKPQAVKQPILGQPVKKALSGLQEQEEWEISEEQEVSEQALEEENTEIEVEPQNTQIIAASPDQQIDETTSESEPFPERESETSKENEESVFDWTSEQTDHATQSEQTSEWSMGFTEEDLILGLSEVSKEIEEQIRSEKKKKEQLMRSSKKKKEEQLMRSSEENEEESMGLSEENEEEESTQRSSEENEEEESTLRSSEEYEQEQTQEVEEGYQMQEGEGNEMEGEEEQEGDQVEEEWDEEEQEEQEDEGELYEEEGEQPSSELEEETATQLETGEGEESSQFQSTSEDYVSSEEFDPLDYQIGPYWEKRPHALGWYQASFFHSYYSDLKRQLLHEKNPYRRELIRNITLAKLNLGSTVDVQVKGFDSEELQSLAIQDIDQVLLNESEDFEEHMHSDENEFQGDQQQQEGEEQSQEQHEEEGSSAEEGSELQTGEEEQYSSESADQLHQSQKIKQFRFNRQRQSEDSEVTGESENETGVTEGESEGVYDESEEMYDDSEGQAGYGQSEEEYDQLQGKEVMGVDRNTEVLAEHYYYRNMTAIKSAIKLEKYELAWGLCEKIFLEPLIVERTHHNVTMAIKSLILEENAKTPIPDVENLLELIQKGVYQLPDAYLRSVHARCENFDELIWQYLPPKDVKFDYWRTALALERGQELIEMDISGKLKQMKYEEQREVVEPREKDGFIANNGADWRDMLMLELGIAKPAPMNQDGAIQTMEFENKDEYFNYVLANNFANEQDLEAIREMAVENGDIDPSQIANQEAAEAAAVQGEGQEEAPAQAVQEEGEPAAEQQGEPAAEQQGETAAGEQGESVSEQTTYTGEEQLGSEWTEGQYAGADSESTTIPHTTTEETLFHEEDLRSDEDLDTVSELESQIIEEYYQKKKHVFGELTPQVKAEIKRAYIVDSKIIRKEQRYYAKRVIAQWSKLSQQQESSEQPIFFDLCKTDEYYGRMREREGPQIQLTEAELRAMEEAEAMEAEKEFKAENEDGAIEGEEGVKAENEDEAIEGEEGVKAQEEQKTEESGETGETEKTEDSQKAEQKAEQKKAEAPVQKKKEEIAEDVLSPEDAALNQTLFGTSNFNASTLRIRGYDFTGFLDLARRKLRPNLQEEYEQEKEYKKHVINLHSLSEEAKLQDLSYLNRKLQEYQRHVKSPVNIATFMRFGLWNYNFLEYSFDPEQARNAAQDFRDKFYNFKKYDGKKGFVEINHEGPVRGNAITLDNEKVNGILGGSDVLIGGKLNEVMIDDMLVHRMRLFKEAEAVVKLAPSPAVQELILWGLRSDEPMGIYLGQKIAMLTNQIISHEVAVQVGHYLSHRREVPTERIERCKEALRVVGRINREHIYDLHQDYQHITHRKHFGDYLEKRQTELDSTALEFLSRVDPTHTDHPETLSRAGMVV